MFEAHVLYLLRQYLGEYVHGLSAEALQISVWKGDVVLKDLQLKAEALNSLKLPLIVKAGFLGSVTIKVPWNRLGNEPVVVLLDRIFILAVPEDERSFEKEDKEKLVEAKRRQIEEAELTTLEAKKRKITRSEDATERSSWLGSLIATIIGNLKVSITNVHIRYEDSSSNPGKPFCAGITLSKLAAVTIDDNGVETFVATGALDKLRKSLQLQSFAIYFDSNCEPWKFQKNWEEMTPQEWSEIFKISTDSSLKDDRTSTSHLSQHQYLLQPVNGMLRYHRCGKQEKRASDVAFQNISLVLNDLSLTVSEGQYCDVLKLLERVSRYKTRIEFSNFRPQVSVQSNARAWWLYACQAEMQKQKKMWNRLSWKSILHLCQLRRRYVHLYVNILLQNGKADIQMLHEIETELDGKIILLWRLLAHAKVESLKSKVSMAQHENTRKSTWWPFGWRSATESSMQSSNIHSDTHDELSEPGHLTKEEWNKINELLSYQPGADSPFTSINEGPNMLQLLFEATVTTSAVRIIDNQGLEVICGAFRNLNIGLKLYEKTTECNLKLQFYGLSAPEGCLIESISREGKEQALTGTFIHHPLNENLDWKLSASVSPCHVTVFMISFERFMQFLRSGHSVSPDIALETATALQNKLEQVTRRAQEQLQLALEEQSRFVVDLDLDAPKIRIPICKDDCAEQTSQLLLDLGHFTLRTADDEYTKDNLYSCFYISGKEMAAFFVDGVFEWSDIQNTVFCNASENPDVTQISKKLFLPVLDPCKMSIMIAKLGIPHPSYPQNSVVIEVPNLCFHFSPSRYSKLLQLLSVFDGSNGPKNALGPTETVETLPSWHPADRAGKAKVLCWKGLGNTVAEWQQCWCVLAGLYLYILESENAQTYQRYASLSGKQVIAVPPSSIGGSEFVIVVCNRSADLQKALESSSTIVLQFKDEDCKMAWMKYIVSVIYRPSAHSSLSLPEALFSDEDHDKSSQHANQEQPLFFLTGSLHSLKVPIYVSMRDESLGVHDETCIIELQAGGAEVHLVQWEYDLTIGMKLHTFKIEDKLQGGVAPSCKYLARSLLGKVDIYTTEAEDAEEDTENYSASSFAETNTNEDSFKDAVSDFGIVPDFTSSPGSHLKSHWVSLMKEYSALRTCGATGFFQSVAESSEVNSSDFVSMQLIMSQIDSPNYDGVDTQISMRMATLDFFCNRPTVVALIDFGTDLSEIVGSESEQMAIPSMNSEGNDIVKGLLGTGKSRVVFLLTLNVNSVRIFLNKEDGSQLAMLAQESFLMDLKVFPASFTIDGSLGNLRVCDMSLGPDHQWGWFCDIRDPGCDSLVKVHFKSYSDDENDYQGFDYSLCGKFSAVRIVFLYRFIQEITVYFTALASPQTQKAIRVVDKVGGIEKFILLSDIDGSPAVKLDISLDTPILVMPRHSASNEFMQLDLGHLQLVNSFIWCGGEKDVGSAVHLDVLLAEITGINMVVGIDGVSGKNMIQEARGLHVKITRPLCDLFKKVPDLQVEVQVETVKGIMSDKEYLVITECASSNIAELPNLPPYFRNIIEPYSGHDESLEAMESTSTDKKDPLSTWTVNRFIVEVEHAELQLFTGIDQDRALACVKLEGLWLGYRSASTLETDLYVTLPKISVLDLRTDTKPEMRLMLGPMSDIGKEETLLMTTYDHISSVSDNTVHPVVAVPHVSMLIMDLRSKPDSQEFVLRIQCPRLLVVVDFLLDVTEFFVPTLSPTTGKQEAANVQNDPFFSHRHVRLNQSLYRQQEAEVTFSDVQKLIVDAAEVDDYIYDGCGGVMYLDIPELTSSAAIHKVQPIIMIGPGKRLFFKNITIKNGLRMQEVVQLSCNSAYSVSPGDGVKLEGSIPQSKTEEKNMNVTDETNAYSSSLKNTENVSSQGPINFIFDIQAVAPELTFYDSAKWSSPNFSRQERLLRARMDLNALYVHKGNDKWIRIFVKGLYIEGGSGLTIVDPLDITAEYACVKEKTSIVLSASDINIRLSFTLIRLMIHLHRDVVSKFQFGGFQAVAKCTHFDQIWINNSGQKVAFWRPKPPEGYAILGDCITSGGGSPSQAVMAVNKIYNRVKRPTHFELIWCFTSDVSSTMKGHDEGSDICCIWRPVPAPGYVAIGCVANLGIAAPPLSTVYCIRSDLLTSASINDCVFYLLPQPGDGKKALSIWRVDNIAGSFFAHQSTGVPSKASLFDLNQMMHQGFRSASRDHDQYKADDNADALWNTGERPGTSQSDIVRMPPTSGYKYATVVQCERMWWDRSNDRNPVSIWRPIPFPGYGIVADQLVEGLEPPNFGLVVQDGGSGQLARPVGYVLFMQWLGKGNEDIYVWYPRASEGYVALGCVVTKTRDTPPLDLVFCVQSNLVNKASISKQAVWSVGSRNNQNSCSIWKVENQVNSFLARPNLERPTSGMAFCLSEAGKTGSEENLIGKTKIGRLSITVYDDLNGLMTPLLNVTITGLNLAAHGYAEALNAVLLSEITASTFNTHLETWEPFIESFEAIMKYESHDEASREIPLRTGKRVRITAPNVLNINATSANLEAFIGGYVAWRKQSDMEQQALSAIDLENCEQENSIDYSFAESALVQDNSEKIVLENRLGTNLFLRTFEHDDTNFQILGVGESTVACLPPSKFPDKMNCFTTNMAASRQHIVIHVLEARELPIIDDCNGQEYFCSLRFINYYKSGKETSVPAQTARSRCVKISDIEKPEDPSIGWAKWNEVFIFDMPQEGLAKLELFVSNQAAGGGKGEVIGTIRLPINEDTAQKLPCPSSLWRNFQQSVRGAHTSATALKGETFTLKSPKSKATSDSSELEKKSYGLLTISIQLLVADSNCPATEAADVMSNYPSTSDVGLWVGLSPNGQWTSIRSLLPVGTISKNLSGTDMALEVTMQHDRKHAVLRSIVMFSNETDIVLEACVCPIALLNTPDESLHYSNNPKSEVDEIFENQRFQPLLGWGSKWPGHLRTDPGRWSNCDYTNSSQSWEVLEPPLTPGWITMSDWSVDKTGYVDESGWAYGLDFHSLKWPALPENSSKKPKLDFVRRRRWFRIRQQVPENIQIHSRHSLGFVEPGSSMPLPFAYTAPHTDYCLQVRPQSNSVTGNFTWGRAVGSLSGANNLLSPSEGSQSSKRSSPPPSRSNTLTSLLMLNQLEKMEELLLCIRSQASSTVKGHSWLSVEADVNILYNDFSSPIYDCKLSVNAPLKLENLLPCAAEYCVWEKKKEIVPGSAERGVVKPGESVYIYTVDIRQPIYATWLIQGGWKPEKDHVLISGPNFDDLPVGLSLIHQQTHRRLQIRLERDFNRSFTKSVRLFVPYWLSNKASLPLSFQLVELDSSGGSETDTPWLIRAVKDAKQATSRSSHSHNKMAHLRRVTQYLEYIEESGGNSIMLSPQAQSNKGSFSPFSPRPGEYMLSSRLGFAVSISKFSKSTYGVSFRDLEDTQSIDLKAKDADGAYYKLSIFLDMSSARTKVINIQPHSLFVNRLGQRLCVRQHDFEHVELIYPHDPPKIFLWQGQVEEEMLSICVDGFNWSNPFSIDSEGIMHVGVNSRQDGRCLFIRVEVRNGVTDSRYLVLFRHVSYSSPYRIENLSVIRPVRIRQTGGNNQSWQFIMTGSAIPFSWEDLQRTRSLDLLIDGEDPRKFSTYDIDTTADHQPNSTQGRPVAALHVSVFKEGTTQVVRVADWTPSDQEGSSIFPIGAPLVDSSREIQLHISVELAEFGLSIVDHTPEELLYFSFQNLIATYGTGLGSRTSRFKLRIDSIQVDNQLPLTPMPVLFRPLIQGSQGNSRDPLFKCTVTMQEQISTEHLKFSYIGIQGPPIPNIVFSININEPIIWRLHYLIERLNMGRLQGSQTTDVALDPIVGIGLLNLSEIKIRVSLAMSPTQRPQGVLGFWSSLMTALGNTDDMPIKITCRVREDISMRKSALIATALSAIKKDLLSHPLQLLSGVDILGNASTALGHMSKGVAALSMDKKFIQGRRKQESKASVEGFGDGFREGAEAFGKGLFRGVTGIITKPYEGAKSSGVEGFVQGVGKGIIGAAAQPVSGVLDLLSKTTEGANAMRMKISAAITSEEQLSRRRLPRAIGSDYILCPYDEYKATGQILMQLAVRGSIFGPVDFFKVRGKYAMTDKYEDHFSLPGGKTLIITNRRAILLQHPTSQVQRQPDLLRNPCTVQWDMEWIHLTNEDLICGEDNTNDRSQLVLHSRVRPQDARIFETKDLTRIIKCCDCSQASQIYVSIEKAKENIRGEVFKPYAELKGTSSEEASLLCEAAEHTPMPESATFGPPLTREGKGNS